MTGGSPKPIANPSPARWDRYAPVIVSANPAHATPEEHAFWEGVAARAAQRGWRLVELAARKIPGTEAGEVFCVPARLHDMAAKMRNLAPVGTSEGLPWVGVDELLRMDEWEHRRWRTAHRDPASYRGLCRLAWHVDSAVRALRPAVVLTTNKIDHGVALPRAAGLHYGCATHLVERSPLDSIWLEPDGIFRESRIWTDWPRAAESSTKRLDQWRRIGRAHAERLAADPFGFRKEEANREDPLAALRDLPRPWVFCPMDNVLWTGWEQAGHPQGVLDHAIWPGPDEALADVAGIVRSIGGTLIVKNHPSCLAIDADRVPEGAVYAEGDLSELIKAADVVACFNTKVAFPALAAGKPVVTLAHNPVAAAGVTEHAVEAGAVEPAIRRALQNGLTEDRKARFETFLGWMETEFFYRCEEPGPDDGHDRGPAKFCDDLIADAERRLPVDPTRDAAPGLELIAKLTAGDRSAQYPGAEPKPAPAKSHASGRDRGAIRVGYDVNRLADLGARFSGISRYTREVSVELSRERDLEIVPTINCMNGRAEGERRIVSDAVRADVGAAPRFGGKLEQFLLPGERPWQVFHTPFGPMPGVHVTGRCARITTVHDCLHVKFPELFPKPGETPAIQRTLDAIDPATDYVICVSEATRRDLLELVPIDPERVAVIMEAADELYFGAEPGWADAVREAHGLERGGYFVGLCQDDPRKNLDVLFAAIARARKEGSLEGLTFVAVCGPRHAAPVAAGLKAAGLPPESYRVLAGLEDREVAGLYAGASFSVYVPLYEGFGLPPLESMAAGCPVIVSATSSLPEVVGDAGLYANPRAVGSVTAQLRTMATTTTLRDRLREAGRARARRFSWRETARQTAAFYRFALDREQRLALGETPRTIRGEPVPQPAPAAHEPRPPAAQRAKAWTRQITAWWRTASGKAILLWAGVLALALAGAPVAAAIWGSAPWWIAAPLALLGAAAAAIAAWIIPYLTLRVQHDLRRDDLAPAFVGLRTEFGGLVSREHERIGRRFTELTARHKAENEHARASLAKLRDQEKSGRAAVKSELATLDERTSSTAQTLEQQREAIEHARANAERATELATARLERQMADAESLRRELRDAAAALVTQQAAAERRHDEHLRELTDRSRRDVDRATNAAAAAERRAGDLERKLAELTTKIDQTADVAARRVRSERAARLADAARAAASSQALSRPDRLMVVLSPQRAGSTWLMDALRAHPSMSLWPTAWFYSGLGLKPMNRYPAGLARTTEGACPIEIQPGVGELIPSFTPPADQADALTDTSLAPVAIEKIHPEFYDFDASIFAEGCDRLEECEGVRVEVLYRVRDPEMVVRSMIRYKRRDPRWYADLPEERVAEFLLRSLESMRRFAAIRPGVVLTYEAHRRDPAEAMRAFFERVWPDGDADRRAATSEWIAEITARTPREGSAFLGARTSDEDREDTDEIIRRSEETIARCRASQAALLDLCHAATPEIVARGLGSQTSARP